MSRAAPELPTLSRTLLRGILPWIVLVVVLTSAVLHLLVTRELTEAFDARLLARAEGLMLITEQDEDGVEFELLPDAQPSYFADVDADYFEVSDSSDTVLFRSATLADRRMTRAADTDTGGQSAVVAVAQPPRFRDRALPDGRPGRTITAGYFPKIDLDDDEAGDTTTPTPSLAQLGRSVEVGGQRITPERLTIRLATSREPLDEQLRSIDMIVVGSGLAIILLTFLATRRVVRRALLPLESLTQELALVGDKSLERRLTSHAGIAELDALTLAFNELLSTLQRTFARERRFVADVSHELRTPLAELRSHVDVGRRFPHDETLRASLLNDVDAATRRMQSLTTNLLALSRNELGLDATSATADLGSILEDAVSGSDDVASMRALQIRLDVPPCATPVIGREHWQSLLVNLVDNAVSYAPDGSIIEICLRHVEHGVRLDIVNAAPDLDANDLEHLFDRLWRKDASRHSERHSGLGLALVRAYATTLGARIDTSLEQGRLRISISAPGEDADVASSRAPTSPP